MADEQKNTLNGRTWGKSTVPCEPYEVDQYNMTRDEMEHCLVDHFAVAVYDAERYAEVQRFGISGVEIDGQFVVIQRVATPMAEVNA